VKDQQKQPYVLNLVNYFLNERSLKNLLFFMVILIGSVINVHALDTEDPQDPEPIIEKNIKAYFDSFYVAKEQDDSLLMANFFMKLPLPSSSGVKTTAPFGSLT
jgi:hypothetical protein